MKYQPIPNSLFTKNRKKFTATMKPGSIAVFNANDIMPTNADGTMAFRQNNDLFWLSGVDQEDTVLVLFPDAHKEEHREMLFLKETSEEIAIWEGAKLTKQQATDVSGISQIHWIQDFKTTFKTIVPEAEHIYLNTNEHLRQGNEVETRDDRFRTWCMATYPLHRYERSAPALHRLRSVKEPEEIELIKRACEITEKGFRRLLTFIKPGVMEYEIEAELWHEFLRNRSQGPAYSMIIGSGFNACVLHYISNNAKCQAGEVILMDFGAEYANYASDLTRCVPVSGQFTSRQKDVYNAVLRVMRASTKLLLPGTYLNDYHKQVGELMEKELVDLGLITMDDIKSQDPAWPAYKKYFMHGTSHYLGLDVHDVGLWTEPIKEGMVFTCEPGIYIREENLGIRIENDILVTKNGQNDLMASIPIEAEEIEDLMNA